MCGGQTGSLADPTRVDYNERMPRPINLADPLFEPTDEEFNGLLQAAFAGLKEAREESLRAMRERIATMQREELARIDVRRG